MSYSRPPVGKKDSWPYKTRADLEAAGYEFLEEGRCRGQHCKAVILWFRTPRDKRMPIDPGTFAPHWSTCPDSKNF